MTQEKLGFISLILSLFLSNSFTQYASAEEPAGPEPASKYSGHFEKIAGSPLLSFFADNKALDPRSSNFFRLWGVSVDYNFVPSAMLDGEFVCKRMGMVWAYGSGTVRVVYCTKDSVDIAETLLNGGYGQEFCAESGNFYGTCQNMEIDK